MALLERINKIDKIQINRPCVDDLIMRPQGSHSSLLLLQKVCYGNHSNPLKGVLCKMGCFKVVAERFVMFMKISEILRLPYKSVSHREKNLPDGKIC